MIPILPEKIISQRATNTALKRLFLQIRHLPLDGARAWMSFPSSSTSSSVAPDFLLIDANSHSYFLTAADLKTNEADEYLQPGLFTLHPEIEQKIQNLQSALHHLAQFPQISDYHTPVFFKNIPRLLFFPDLTDAQTHQVCKQLQAPNKVLCFGLSQRRLSDILASLPSHPLDKNQISQLRASYLPECRVPATFIPRLSSIKVQEHNRSERFTDYLLDFDQESWIKHDLQLDPSHASPATSAGTTFTSSNQSPTGQRSRVITGVAGSGKSLTLLYRAKILSTLEPHRRILFITHNKPLIGDLQWRYNEIRSFDGNAHASKVDFFHFFRWLGSIYHQPDLPLISASQSQQTIVELAKEIFPHSPWPASFFTDELGFIADQVDDSCSAYITLDRSGRGLALDSKQRHKMHNLYTRYRMRLASNREADWHSLVRFWWEKAHQKQIRLPRYDCIFVDEAQFFAPLWFSILKLCLHPQHGELIVAADPTQGFLKRRQSWKAVGLDVRGRTTKLHRCYRNTAALQSFSRRFFLQRQPDQSAEESLQLPEKNQQQHHFDNNTPHPQASVQLIRHPTPQDSLTWISNEIVRVLEKGLAPQALLVIHHNRSQLELLQKIISQRIGVNKVGMLSHQETARYSVALATLNSATGIERPIVFLAGIDELFELEGDPRLEKHERENMIRDHTRKIYMALTRAGEKLLISYTGDLCRKFFDDHLLD